MRESRHPLIRKLLHTQGDMTAADLAKHFDTDAKSIRNALDKMPDVYIDRWVYRNGCYAAVWSAVEVPEDCPHPEGKR